MVQVTVQAPAAGSRLVRYLQDLAVASTPVSHKNFADRLGRMIDLSYSITLSEALRSLPKLECAVPNGSAELARNGSRAPSLSLRDEFLAERRNMVEFIAQSFVRSAEEVAFCLPKPVAETFADVSAGFVPCQRFYALHQSEMDFRILKLRNRVRQAVATQSRAMTQLATLDATLADTLASHTRKAFGGIPRLLGKHFQALAAAALRHNPTIAANPDLWIQPEGWLATFYNDMQGLLLAELDVRLQPVVGLIEALDADPAPVARNAEASNR